MTRLVLRTLFTTVIFFTLYDGQSHAQNLVDQVIWPRNSGEVWKSSQNGTDFGTAWRQLAFDDSGWIDESVKFYASHGSVPNDGRGYYFRKEFQIDNLFNIDSIKASFYYDDAAVLFLNGQEVYRTIRNNLPSDPELSIYQNIPYGGAEDAYIVIPASSNRCEEGCTDTSTDPIPVDLLLEGTNVIGIMAWTTPSSDLGTDLALTITRDLNVVLPDIAINEVVASNNGGLLDEDGDDPDWIELYNNTNEAVNLEGWVLQDLETEWIIPNISLLPNEYKVIFASSKDRQDPNSELHTNFKIGKTGDALILTNLEGYVVDEISASGFPQQFENVSWGRGQNDRSMRGYLDLQTPGNSNSILGSNFAPILRKFSDRIYNVGEDVSIFADGFDPDGAPVIYSMNPNPPGISIDPSTGEISGTLDQVGEFTAVITITDEENLTETETVTWFVIDSPAGPPRFVLNEYNGVAPDRFLDAGMDPRFGMVLGNGGDWFEFVVVEEGLDLRGWTIELWDRDHEDGLMELSSSLVFNQRVELSSLQAGTIITVSEDLPDDTGFYPPGDWHLNLQSNDLDEGGFFTADSQENFNSTRSNQVVMIRNAQGGLESPAVGETDAWDFIEGVNGGEVFTNCINPNLGESINPLLDFDDSSEFSSFGQLNDCRVKNDPLDPNDDTFFLQDFGDLRDTDGDGTVDNNDIDTDNDGIPDVTEKRNQGQLTSQADDDGIDNYLDLDSDNDGIPDILEAGLIDLDGDFKVDDPAQQGSIFLPRDSDSDSRPDYQDIESNNPSNNGTDFDIDGTPFANLDTNNDGVVNGDDANGGQDINGNGIDDLIEDLMDNLSNEKPTVLISEPENFSTFDPGTPITIVFSATDPDPGDTIDSVRVSVGSRTLATIDSGPPWTYTTILPPGKYDLHAQAWDNHAAEAESVEDPRISVESANACDNAINLVLNEINYNDPVNLQVGDWVEIYNPNLSPVDLEAWVLKDSDQGNWIVFSEGTIVNGRGFRIVAQDTTEFIDGYAGIGIVDFGKPILGNTVWGLSNSGDQVQLYNPDGCRVDKVQYSDESPWPLEPDGQGPTLELVDPSLDNLAAENWQASGDSPGGSPGFPNTGQPDPPSGPGVLLRLKVNLSGAFSFFEMRTELLSKGVLPLTHPYQNVNPSSISQDYADQHPEIVDWIWIELRSELSASSAEYRTAFPLSKSGQIIDPETGSINARLKGVEDGDYYVVVGHRNHLSVMSAGKLSLSSSGISLLDFTQNMSSAYQSNGNPLQVLSNGRLGLFSGELTGDQIVTYAGGNNDRVEILGVLGGPTPFDFIEGYLLQDLNLDGKVLYSGGSNDRVEVLNASGGATPFDMARSQVPE